MVGAKWINLKHQFLRVHFFFSFMIANNTQYCIHAISHILNPVTPTNRSQHGSFIIVRSLTNKNNLTISEF